MAQVVICLEPPASLTPELRAWISHRAPNGRAALTRGRLPGSDSVALLLRVDVNSASEDVLQEEITDLMTDLRLLGLRPILVSEQVA